MKDSDIPKLKEIYKTINKTIMEYADTINKLEQNKDMVFHDKFIDFSKLTLKKICKNWNEELSQFKEEHFKTMIDNYRKEVSELKKESTKLISELESMYNEINEKKIEILKLNEKIKSDKEIFNIKEQIIRDTQAKYENAQKDLEICKVRLKDKENIINEIQTQFGYEKTKAYMFEDVIDNMKEILNAMIKNKKDIKEIKAFNSVLNKLPDDIKTLIEQITKNYNIMK